MLKFCKLKNKIILFGSKMSSYELFLEKVSMSKLSAISKKYYYNVETIECEGEKCRIHANDFGGVHCESCFGHIYKVNLEDIDEKV